MRPLDGVVFWRLRSARSQSTSHNTANDRTCSTEPQTPQSLRLLERSSPIKATSKKWRRSSKHGLPFYLKSGTFSAVVATSLFGLFLMAWAVSLTWRVRPVFVTSSFLFLLKMYTFLENSIQSDCGAMKTIMRGKKSIKRLTFYSQNKPSRVT